MGILHGGTTAAIIDDAVGAAVYFLGKPNWYTTVNLAVDYFASAKVGDTIIAQTSITKNGNKIVNTACEIWNADKTRMIAKGHSNLIKIDPNRK
jgi:acyl-coenzyme A thioesterase 13